MKLLQMTGAAPELYSSCPEHFDTFSWHEATSSTKPRPKPQLKTSRRPSSQSYTTVTLRWIRFEFKFLLFKQQPSWRTKQPVLLVPSTPWHQVNRPKRHQTACKQQQQVNTVACLPGSFFSQENLDSFGWRRKDETNVYSIWMTGQLFFMRPPRLIPPVQMGTKIRPQSLDRKLGR